MLECNASDVEQLPVVSDKAAVGDVKRHSHNHDL